MSPSETEPETFFDVQFDVARMREAELPNRMLATKLAIALHRCTAIWADLNHGDSIDDTMVVLGMRGKSLDHEPVFGESSTHLSPTHASH